MHDPDAPSAKKPVRIDTQPIDERSSTLRSQRESKDLHTLAGTFYQASARRLQAAQDALRAALGLGRFVRKSGVWSPKEIAAVKARLNKPLAEYRPADWLELVDLIVQTRLPPEFIAAQADLLAWKAALAGALQAIAEGGNTASPADLGALMEQVAPARTCSREPCPAPETRRKAAPWTSPRPGKQPENLSEYDFLEYLIPHLQRIAVFPSTLSAHDIDAFYRFLYQTIKGQPTLWKRQSALRERYGIENLDFEAIAVVAASGIANVEHLLRAKNNKFLTVKVLSHYSECCASCKTDISGKTFDVDALLGAYLAKTNTLGILPHAHCLNEWCRCRFMPVPDETPPPGVDPDFHAWLIAALQDRNAELDRRNEQAMLRLRAEQAKRTGDQS
ncbi:hypothetical protein [Lamprocystis purpurea]|uniref:hypothetical protein n=1 Tax=Lamprocystis purpurea TaxID=61598 RepID=UPI00036296E8|nr:hypothetical protein [Lamprocystis purpurea]